MRFMVGFATRSGVRGGLQQWTVAVDAMGRAEAIAVAFADLARRKITADRVWIRRAR